MLSPRQLVRALIACLALCLAAGPALAEAVWTEATVLSSSPPARISATHQHRATALRARPAVSRARPAVLPALPPAERSLESSERLVLLEDVYLRNCALLR